MNRDIKDFRSRAFIHAVHANLSLSKEQNVLPGLCYGVDGQHLHIEDWIFYVINGYASYMLYLHIILYCEIEIPYSIPCMSP